MNGQQTSYGVFTYVPISSSSYTVTYPNTLLTFYKVDNMYTSGQSCWQNTYCNYLKFI